jgi:hypothetical protein
MPVTFFLNFYSCKATVRETKESFIEGAIAHCHAPKIGLLPACQVKAAVQKKTRDNPFQPASKIVEECLSVIPPNAITECIPEHAYLMRTTNRRREKPRPQNPETLDFALDNKFIPDGFLKADIKVKERCHIVFATDDMLSLLSKAKTWYMDVTLKLVNKPFTQMFSIHAFVKGDDETAKQVPLVYVLMSGKGRKDYLAVFNNLKELIPVRKVQCFMVDFEAAIWTGLRQEFS